MKKNALQILIPKYGLEGTLYLTPPKGVEQEVTFTFNDEVRYLINSRFNILQHNHHF